MKIAQITSTIWPYRYGGRERHVYYLSKNLQKLGYDITIYTAGKSAHRGFLEGIRICWLPSLTIPLLHKDTMLHARFSPFLINSLMKDKPDLIHLHDYGSFTLGTTLATILKKIPLIITLHGPLGVRSWPTISQELKIMLNLYDYTFFRLTLSLASKVFAVSNNIRDSLLQSKLIKGEKVLVIPNGIDTTGINFANATRFREKYGLYDEKIVLCVGRVIKEKGYWRLAMIPSNIINKWRNYVKIVIIGSDEGYLSELKRLFKKNGAENVLLFLGQVPDITLYDAYAAADVVALPSDVEGLPIRLLESMAFGKAIVAIKAGEISLLIKNEIEGILVDPLDIYGFHQAIDFLLNDTKLNESLGLNAKEKSKQYDWDNIIKFVNNVYQETLTTHP